MLESFLFLVLNYSFLIYILIEYIVFSHLKRSLVIYSWIHHFFFLRVCQPKFILQLWSGQFGGNCLVGIFYILTPICGPFESGDALSVQLTTGIAQMARSSS